MAIEPRTVTTVPAAAAVPAEPVRAGTATVSPDDRPAGEAFRAIAMSNPSGGPLPSVIVAGFSGGVAVRYYLLGQTVGCVEISLDQVKGFVADNLRWQPLSPMVEVSPTFPTATPILDKGRLIING